MEYLSKNVIFCALVIILCYWTFWNYIEGPQAFRNYFLPKYAEDYEVYQNEGYKEFRINFKNIKIPYWMTMPMGQQCPNGTKLLILIMSRRSYSHIRAVIRQTWAKDALPGTILRFFIADPSNVTAKSIEEQRNLEMEQANFGDLIIQKGFVDSYANLHLIMYGAFEWQMTYCPNVQWILENDEDTVVHLPRLDYWIEHKFGKELTKNQATAFGVVFKGSKPFRDKNSRWYALESSFPGSVYPDFVHGVSVLLSRQVISAIMAHTGEVVGFNLDDVVFTGILASLGNVSLFDQPRFSLKISEWNGTTDCEDGVPTTVSLCSVDPMQKEYEIAYEKLKTAECN